MLVQVTFVMEKKMRVKNDAWEKLMRGFCRFRKMAKLLIHFKN